MTKEEFPSLHPRGLHIRLAEDREFFYHYDCEGNLVFKEFKEMALRGGIVAPIN